MITALHGPDLNGSGIYLCLTVPVSGRVLSATQALSDEEIRFPEFVANGALIDIRRSERHFVVQEVLTQIIEMHRLGFDQPESNAAYPASARSHCSAYGPSPETGAQLEHGELVHGLRDRFQKIDPLEIFLVDRREISGHECGAARRCRVHRQTVVGEVVGTHAGSDEIDDVPDRNHT